MRGLSILVSAAALAALGASMGAAQDGAQASTDATGRSYDMAGFEVGSPGTELEFAL